MSMIFILSLNVSIDGILHCVHLFFWTCPSSKCYEITVFQKLDTASSGKKKR
jgi:hypothetical protein